MKPIDYGRAFGAAVLVLTLDLICAVLAVTFWSLVIEPGHPRSFYIDAAPAISTISTRIAGPLLFVFWIWFLSRREPARNPFLYAGVTFVFYYLIDGALVGFQAAYFAMTVVATMAAKLAGAMVGAALAARAHARIVEAEEIAP